jgi:hypothetical protein
MAPKDPPRVDESTKFDVAAEERYQKARKNSRRSGIGALEHASTPQISGSVSMQ